MSLINKIITEANGIIEFTTANSGLCPIWSLGHLKIFTLNFTLRYSVRFSYACTAHFGIVVKLFRGQVHFNKFLDLNV